MRRLSLPLILLIFLPMASLAGTPGQSAPPAKPLPGQLQDPFSTRQLELLAQFNQLKGFVSWTEHECHGKTGDEREHCIFAHVNPWKPAGPKGKSWLKVDDEAQASAVYDKVQGTWSVQYTTLPNDTCANLVDVVERSGAADTSTTDCEGDEPGTLPDKIIFPLTTVRE